MIMVLIEVVCQCGNDNGGYNNGDSHDDDNINSNKDY